MTERRWDNPGFARGYARVSVKMEARGVAEHRRRLLSGLAGRVCEVGAGNGLNFGHYPPSVRSVVAVEPEPNLRALARAAAPDAPVGVTVVGGTAEALPLADGCCDAVVVSLVLCSVARPAGALAEARRVLRADGRLLFYEHVRSASRLVGLTEDAVAPLWSRLAGGCHPNRDTVAAVRAAGFDVTALERFGFRPVRLLPPTAHVIGTAVARDTR